jgi:hypothetical protein
MQTIGIRELKNRLSEVLRAVKAGAGERAIGRPERFQPVSRRPRFTRNRPR